MDLEKLALEHFAREEFSPVSDLEGLARLYGEDPTRASLILDKWRVHKWFALVDNVDDLPPLLQLTDKAFVDNPWLPGAST